MHPHLHPYRTTLRNTGFSLVEVMVGVAIALVAALVIMQVFAMFEGQKRTTTSGSDAQTDGAIGLFTMERDVRMAGYGLSIPSALGCKVNSSFNGTTTAFSLSPVEITNGANGLPDSIRVLSSSKTSWSVPARITTDHPPTATNMFLNSTQGIAVGDLLIGFQAGKDCTLLQVTGIPNGNVQIHHQNTSPWNPPGGQNIYPQPDGYTSGAMLFNLGAMINRTYSINAGSNLQLADFQSATNTTVTQSIVPNMVNLQAQYGFDTRIGAQTDGRVDTWSDTMIDADSSGTIGNAGDIQRIYAVRMALVARSGLKEKPALDGTCSVTTATSPNRPTWTEGDIDVSKNPDGTANSDWQCYRYKVFETIVPLRNLLWRAT